MIKNFAQQGIDGFIHCIGNLPSLLLSKNIKAQNYSFEKQKGFYCKKKNNITTLFYTTQQVLAEGIQMPKNVKFRKCEIVKKVVFFKSLRNLDIPY